MGCTFNCNYTIYIQCECLNVTCTNCNTPAPISNISHYMYMKDYDKWIFYCCFCSSSILVILCMTLIPLALLITSGILLVVYWEKISCRKSKPMF